MKKNLFILTLILALPFGFFGCGDDKEENEEWRLLNQDAYNDIVKNDEYHAVTTPESATGVYAKVLKSGEGTVHPYQTSKVRVHYKSYYYEGTVFDKGTYASDNELVGIRKLNETAYMLRGLSVALQTMVVGDKWEVVVPYYLGQGTSDVSSYRPFQLCHADGTPVSTSETTFSVAGYSTLFFEVELLAIDEL